MYQHLGNTGIVLYYVFDILSFISALIFNLTLVNKKKNFPSTASIALFNCNKSNTRITIISFVEMIIISVLQIGINGVVNPTFGNLVGTGANYFGTLFINTIIIFIFCFLIGLDVFKLFDLITVTYPFALVFAKIACFCHGCCSGVPWVYGLYNHSTDRLEFPVQLIELGLAVLIFIFLIFYRKKAEEGTLFPTYLIIYSATRFFSEFLRAEPNVLWIFKTYQLLCIAGVIIGLFELYLVKNHRDKITQLSEAFSELMIQCTNRVALKLGIKREKNIIHHKKRKKK